MSKKDSNKDSVRVCARFRPQNKLEIKENGKRTIQISEDNSVVFVKNPENGNQYRFDFDYVFDTDASQPGVFKHSVQELVELVVQGYNCTVFAYGQTGTGKTYSMEGELGSPYRGIIPRTVEHIFQLIQEADEQFEFTLKVSNVEIYLEKLRDLFNKKNKRMQIVEDQNGVRIQGVTEFFVSDEQEVMDLMKVGASNRVTQKTRMNEASSRSHAVFMLKLTNTDKITGSKKISKLMLVDLAGSEKVGKTEAKGTTLDEAKKINQSLSALGNVMNALTKGAKHVPYRDSELTRLLSDSLGGNCKTCLMVMASESSYNAAETISTMRFGVRAKQIKNKAKVNAEKTVAEYKREVIQLNKKIRQLQDMVKALEHDLDNSKAGTLTPDNELYVKLMAGETIDLGPSSVDKKSPKVKTKFNLSEIDFENGGKTAFDEEIDVAMPMPENGGGSIPLGSYNIKPTNEGAIFKIGDQVSDVAGRVGTVQRIFYIEDCDVRWEDNNTVQPKIPAFDLNNVFPDCESCDLNSSSKDFPSIEDSDHDNFGNVKGDSDEDDVDANMSDGNGAQRNQKKNSKDILIPKPNHKKNRSGHSMTASNGKSRDFSVSPRNFEFGVNKDFSYVPNHKTVPFSRYQKATRIALDLQAEIDDWQKRFNKVEKNLLVNNSDLMKKQTLLDIKSEALVKEQQKREEAEVTAGRINLKFHSLEEQFKIMELEKKKLEYESDELKKIIENNEVEHDKMQSKLEEVREDAHKELALVRKQEKTRAKQFIEAAQMAINQTPIKTIGNMANQYRRQSKILTHMKDKSFLEMQNMKLEQLKLEQDLRTKVEQYLDLKIMVVTKDDTIDRLRKELKVKDASLKRQHDELSDLGKLKFQSDKYYAEKAIKDEQKIIDGQQKLRKLRRVLSKLNHRRMDKMNRVDSSADISVTKAKKLGNIALPLRGGGGRKNKNNKRLIIPGKKKKCLLSDENSSSPNNNNPPLKDSDMNNYIPYEYPGLLYHDEYVTTTDGTDGSLHSSDSCQGGYYGLRHRNAFHVMPQDQNMMVSQSHQNGYAGHVYSPPRQILIGNYDTGLPKKMKHADVQQRLVYNPSGDARRNIVNGINNGQIRKNNGSYGKNNVGGYWW